MSMRLYSLQQRFHGALLTSTIAQQVSHGGEILAVEPTPAAWIQWLCQSGQTTPPRLSANPLAAALALLPLWLYCHESWRQRHAWLRQIPTWPDADQSTLWLYGEAIAQVLRPDCQPQHLIPNLKVRWLQHAQSGAPDYTAEWQQQLDQIQGWQQMGQTIAAIQPALRTASTTDSAIAVSLFCWMTTPNDLPLARSRAAQLLAHQPPIIAQRSYGLIGGLMGAYNGWSHLPIHWLGSISPFELASQQLIQSWSGAMPQEVDNAVRSRNCPALPTVISPR